MSDLCPLYLKEKSCLLKIVSNSKITSVLSKLDFNVVDSKWNNDCEGSFSNCCFAKEQELELVAEAVTENKIEETKQEEVVEENTRTKVSIHIVNNPYAVKSDVLFYPTNIALTIDDPLMMRLSFGKIQEECDTFKKPYKMGTLYITSNGGENSKVQPKNIYHLTVSGVSRLVNEGDVKSAMRKALAMADSNKAKNVVVLPADCGTHDINDVARVQLSSIKTFLGSHKDCSIKNIFIVMEDKESYEVFEEYYNRIFD
jgi:O-acetyl-ADP-ribose deacetylase (regulator of RNase III)